MKGLDFNMFACLGDVTFHDGVTLDGVLNDYDVASLEKQIWLRDRDTVLRASIHFHIAHFSKINLEGNLESMWIQ